MRKGYSAQNTLLASDLVGYWRFDETGGTVHDLSGQGNDGGTSGDVTQGEIGLLSSDSYFFDSDDRVEIPDSSTLGGSSFSEITLTAWVYPTNTNDWPRIISKGNYDSYHLRLNNDMTIAACFSLAGETRCDGSNKNTLNSVDQVEMNEWNLISATWDGDTAKVYINDSLENSVSHSGSSLSSSSSDLNIPRQNYEYNGKIDEVRIYERALSTSEITKIYETVTLNGSITTEWKTFNEHKDSNTIKLNMSQSDLQGGKINVEVESDTDGDNNPEETSQQIQLESGTEIFEVNGLSTESQKYRIRTSLNSSTPEETPSISSVKLKGENARPAICDSVGPNKECISENTHDIDGQDIQVDSKFEAKNTALFEAFNTQAQLNITNSSTFSGIWTGTFNLTADQITIKPGADFRPRNGRIILGEN